MCKYPRDLSAVSEPQHGSLFEHVAPCSCRPGVRSRYALCDQDTRLPAMSELRPAPGLITHGHTWRSMAAISNQSRALPAKRELRRLLAKSTDSHDLVLLNLQEAAVLPRTYDGDSANRRSLPRAIRYRPKRQARRCSAGRWRE